MQIKYWDHGIRHTMDLPNVDVIDVTLPAGTTPGLPELQVTVNTDAVNIYLDGNIIDGIDYTDATANLYRYQD